jgi:hypothetical protein
LRTSRSSSTTTPQAAPPPPTAIDHATTAQRAPRLWLIDPDLLDDAKDPSAVIQQHGIDTWHARTCAPARAISWLASLPARLTLERSHALDTLAAITGINHLATGRALTISRMRGWW